MYKTASSLQQSRTERRAILNFRKIPSAATKRVHLAFIKKKKILGKIFAVCKGGYTVDLKGFFAFCPNSEMWQYPKTKIEKLQLVGKSFHFSVLKMQSDTAVVSSRKSGGPMLKTNDNNY
jgi:ribosomal protein S1